MKESNSGLLIPFTALYALGILGFSIIVPVFAMAAHPFENLDFDFQVVLLISLAIMPMTAILLFRAFLGAEVKLKSSSLLLTLLSIITLIFSYYFYEAVTDEYAEEIAMFHFIPLVGLVTTVIVATGIMKLKNNLR
ncbi:hypothetical protein [Botryobacter ruber]|uniref:hypothetical protein n=1 Tax=Botryobacter ruber TaxID=2171629 RepID=UPI000E0C6972|nr:hypothetical protein [Botryobacter ruber]